LTALEIVPDRSALLVLDFQNETVEPGGSRYANFQGELAKRNTVANAADAIRWARLHSIEVIFVTVGWRAGYPEQSRSPQMSAAQAAGGFQEGTWGTQVTERLARMPTDILIHKRGVSAFNGTELQRYLTVRRLSTLLLAGVATNWAVESTARDAADLGYRVITLLDCCASFSGEMHEFSADRILPLLGAVTTVAELKAAPSTTA